MKFIYKDNKNKGEIVFEYVADSILDADKAYQEEIGKNVIKQPHIGCIVLPD